MDTTIYINLEEEDSDDVNLYYSLVDSEEKDDSSMETDEEEWKGFDKENGNDEEDLTKAKS